MIRAKYILAVAFLMVCAAGAGVGVAVDRHVHAAPPHRQHHGLAAILNLTPPQQEKMKAIWSHVEQVRNQTFHERHEIEQQREKDIVGLLSADQKQQYDLIQQHHHEQVDTLKTEMGQAVHDAEQQTRAMLTPEQQTKYDQLRARMGPFPHNGPHGRPHGGPRGGPHRGHPPMPPPASAPSHG